jgi:SAM-dependent methyltransferase
MRRTPRDKAPAAEYDGYLDGVDSGAAYGWAASLADSSQAVNVAVRCNGRVVGHAVANMFREDLRRIGVCQGHGNYGFRLPVPQEIRALRNYTLSAHAGQEELKGSPIQVSEEPEFPFRHRGSHIRDFLAQQYLYGSGIEIGALNLPARVPEGTVVKYVDSKPAERLIETYRNEMHGHTVVPVDLVTDAQTLDGVENESQDFVIANQVVEHLENPLLALRNMLRVTKPGGAIFLSLPDKRHTFDVDRPVTTFEHVLEDYRRGPEWSRESHYREWIEKVEKLPAAEVPGRLDALMNVMQYSIHFHAWTQFELFEFFERARRLPGFSYEIDCFKANDFEALFVLRKI